MNHSVNTVPISQDVEEETKHLRGMEVNIDNINIIEEAVELEELETR